VFFYLNELRARGPEENQALPTFGVSSWRSGAAEEHEGHRAEEEDEGVEEDSEAEGAGEEDEGVVEEEDEGVDSEEEEEQASADSEEESEVESEILTLSYLENTRILLG
jgi:hypothetical protein